MNTPFLIVIININLVFENGNMKMRHLYRNTKKEGNNYQQLVLKQVCIRGNCKPQAQTKTTNANRLENNRVLIK